MSIDQQALAELPSTRRDLDGGALELDDIFALLKNQRRRRVLRHLAEIPDGRATLSDLAEHVAGLENGVDPVQLSSGQRKRVYIALYQTHLPKLDDYGVVEYDRDRGTIALGDTSQLDPYLERAAADRTTTTDDADPDPDRAPPAADGEPDATDTAPAAEGMVADDRSDLYVASATAVVVLVGLAGIGPLSAISGGLWTVLSVAALLWVAAG